MTEATEGSGTLPTEPGSSAAAGRRPDIEATIDKLISADGWVYASTESVERGDPGRFHALFGRDSLIFALQLLPARPEIAAATLRALAGLQGRIDDPEIEEQPGRIIHEYRPVAPEWMVAWRWPLRDGGIRYYGTSDATSWWLVLLAATEDPALQAELADTTKRAAAWLESALEAGRGFVRCGPRISPGGLSQQGWRDALDPGHDEGGGGIVTEDDESPAAPLADADSQAVAVAALRALVTLDPERAEHWQDRLTALRTRIGEVFGPEVMALDGNDDTVSGAGTQLGWLLWSGAFDDDAADGLIDRLTSPDVLTAYGLRTLSAHHPAFLYRGYHRGGVWPFDNWICWLGLRAYGRDELAEKVRAGVLAAVEQLGRFPELYAVTPDGDAEVLPMANRIQAWTVGAVWAFTRPAELR